MILAGVLFLMVIISVIVICILRKRNSKQMQVLPFRGSFSQKKKMEEVGETVTDIGESTTNLLKFEGREIAQVQKEERESEYKSMKFSINPDLDKTYSTVSLMSNNDH